MNQYLKIYRYGFLYGFPAGQFLLQTNGKTRYPLQDNGFLWSCYPDLNWEHQIVKDIASSPQSGSVDFSNKAVVNFNLLFPCAVLVLNGLMDKDFFNQGV